jgi:hypothetical protein
MANDRATNAATARHGPRSASPAVMRFHECMTVEKLGFRGDCSAKVDSANSYGKR